MKEFRDLRERFESEVVTQVNEPLVLQLDRCYSRGKTVIQYSCNENDYDYNGNKLSLLSFYFKYYYNYSIHVCIACFSEYTHVSFGTET